MVVFVADVVYPWDKSNAMDVHPPHYYSIRA
jgi:hypothetical protein